MKIQQIPEQFVTKRLLVKDIEPDEIATAQALYQSSAYMGRWDGHGRSDQGVHPKTRLEERHWVDVVTEIPVNGISRFLSCGQSHF